jgi:hypothetical protein
VGKGEHQDLSCSSSFFFFFFLPVLLTVKLNSFAPQWNNCCPLIEQEGQKPSQIISPQLDVRGIIKREASNGNTNVLINSREITKDELLMLKVGPLDALWFF